MEKRRVSPNRMELMKLNNELRTARRGHRLLKDKRDGLMQKFLEILDETLAKRNESDLLLQKAADSMALASSVIDPEVLMQTMQLSTEPLQVHAETRSIMSVQVPVFTLPQLEAMKRRESELESDNRDDNPDRGTEEESEDNTGSFLGYGMVQTTGDIDIAFDALTEALKPLLELATLEKTLQILAVELENTRRRVNSLEHVLIPELQQTIREIRMKMDENERDNLTRLMKVKDMLVEQEIEARRKADERSRLAEA